MEAFVTIEQSQCCESKASQATNALEISAVVAFHLQPKSGDKVEERCQKMEASLRSPVMWLPGYDFLQDPQKNQLPLVDQWQWHTMVFDGRYPSKQSSLDRFWDTQ